MDAVAQNLLWSCGRDSSRLRKNSVDANNIAGIPPQGANARIISGCSKRLSGKAAASEEARRYIPSFA